MVGTLAIVMLLFIAIGGGFTFAFAANSDPPPVVDENTWVCRDIEGGSRCERPILHDDGPVIDAGFWTLWAVTSLSLAGAMSAVIGAAVALERGA